MNRAKDWEALVEGNAGIIASVSRAYASNASDREDLAQEIAIALWRSFSNYDAGRNASTWVYRVALNVAISRLRKETRHLSTDVLEPDGLADIVAQPDAQAERLYDALASFDPLARAIVLMWLDGYAYIEIAQTLGMSESNVGTTLSRTRARLKAALSEESVHGRR